MHSDGQGDNDQRKDKEAPSQRNQGGNGKVMSMWPRRLEFPNEEGFAWLIPNVYSVGREGSKGLRVRSV